MVSSKFSRFLESAVEILAVDLSHVTLDERFREDFDAGNLDLVELIVASEDVFDLRIDDDDDTDLVEIATVGQAFDLGSQY